MIRKTLRWIAIAIAIAVGCVVLLAGCQPSDKDDVIRVGTIVGPETGLMEVAKRVAWRCYHLRVRIVPFTDYNTPNTALSDGSIDANMFQHLPFLKATVKARGYKLVPVAKTFVYPMGVYSKRIARLSQLKPGDEVAIPNDPSNEARALLLLQKAGVIRLKHHVGVTATLAAIRKNPKRLRFVALQAAQLPRALNDVAAAVINTNYAVPAGLKPSQALVKEDAQSPYANVLVVRAKDARSQKVRELIASLHSKAVLKAADRIFGDSAIPAWNTKRQFPKGNC